VTTESKTISLYKQPSKSTQLFIPTK